MNIWCRTAFLTAAFILLLLPSACTHYPDSPDAWNQAELPIELQDKTEYHTGEYLYESAAGYRLKTIHSGSRLLMHWSQINGPVQHQILLDGSRVYIKRQDMKKAKRMNDPELKESLIFIRDWLTCPRAAVARISVVKKEKDRTVLKLTLHNRYPFDKIEAVVDRKNNRIAGLTFSCKRNPDISFRMNQSDFQLMENRILPRIVKSDILDWTHQLTLKEYHSRIMPDSGKLIL